VPVGFLRLRRNHFFTVPLEDKMATTYTTTANATVKIVVNDKGNAPGKLADAELHFTDGILAGLKLIGFAIWERRSGVGRNVTFPARQYAVNGERRSCDRLLIRPLRRRFVRRSWRHTPRSKPQANSVLAGGTPCGAALRPRFLTTARA
jgi:hypothetical protein